MHINVLKLKAAFVGIRTYYHRRSYKHIRVMSDRSTAIACINNKGGIKVKKRNEIAKEIWLRYFKNNSFNSSAQMPGKHNNETDKFSRKFNNYTEWQLILRYLLKLPINLPTQKLFFLLPE